MGAAVGEVYKGHGVVGDGDGPDGPKLETDMMEGRVGRVFGIRMDAFAMVGVDSVLVLKILA